MFYQLLTGKYMFGNEDITIPALEANVKKGVYTVSKDLKISL